MIDHCVLCNRLDILLTYITDTTLKCCSPIVEPNTILQVCDKCMDMIDLYLNYLI
jgi:hypothetical protein